MKLSASQIRAIELKKDIGEKLAEESPEIAEEWRKGSIASEIARKYTPDVFKFNRDIAIGAVLYALNKLLGSEEARNKFVEKARDTGLESKLEKTGLFSLTPEKMEKIRRRGVVARGLLPYTESRDTEFGYLEERKYIELLRAKGLEWRGVRDRVNNIFCHNRTTKEIKLTYQRELSKHI